MKAIKLLLALSFLFILNSCVSTLPLNKQFYNDKKVGIILQVDSIGMAKSGSQGLLDIALTSGNRFTKVLKNVEAKFNLQDTLRSEITYIMNSKKKKFQFIGNEVVYENLEKFEKPKSDQKFSKKDFRNLKESYKVDEIMYVKVKYGLLVSYYGMIELDKQGYVDIYSEVVNLTDNSLLQKENSQTISKIKGNWKEGEDFSNLTSSIQEAINNSIKTLRTKF